MVVLLLLLLVGSVNYGKSLGYMLTFLLAGLGNVAMFSTWRNLAGLDVDVQFFDDKNIRHADGQVLAGEQAHCRTLARFRSNRKSGTPSSAVSTPTGSCSGLISVRAAASASSNRLPPVNTAAGSRTR